MSSMPFALASDSGARSDSLDHLSERVVLEREGELSGLDLREIEHVVDQAEEVLAIAPARARAPSCALSGSWP